jgi:hypothetical protein
MSQVARPELVLNAKTKCSRVKNVPACTTNYLLEHILYLGQITRIWFRRSFSSQTSCTDICFYFLSDKKYLLFHLTCLTL